jgi:hypothetical protein
MTAVLTVGGVGVLEIIDRAQILLAPSINLDTMFEE